ncbi:Hsp33 family molecular chaperone HslO [Bacteriovorax sp. Seq25_V]|uniref:Hsp33 family molecular chaperone HslO n=1 Tax=Bacteriovorax sp. Seq25_V TaxID=1201288 RepID=UPI00038A055E|nr:Hsp33 family molecular chaperone HslO [Bacteriovorax sp. Seq25_V]EQC44702.1 chaperonin HslO [Bacteriovorax sp. Seq25_V]
MLPQSRLYNFIDSENGFTISFLEGQKVIQELAMIHDVKGNGFSFFRDSVLSGLQLINYLKPGENFGFFIDSEEPYFRLKIEMNFDGYMRTLLLPANFEENPKTFSGNVRLVKLMPNSHTPYQSIIAVKNKSLKEIVNDVLKDSYQMNSKVIISDDSDQSVLISRLPDLNVNKKETTERISLEDYSNSIKDHLTNFLKDGETDYEKITTEFKKIKFELLTSKDIEFKCNCSRERMLTGVASVARGTTLNDLFDGKKSLEAKCDYCNTNYLITYEEIEEILKISKQ